MLPSRRGPRRHGTRRRNRRNARSEGAPAAGGSHGIGRAVTVVCAEAGKRVAVRYATHLEETEEPHLGD